MYKITVDGHVVQDSTENLVISPVLTEKVNSVNSLEYIIPFNDPLYDKYERRISKVVVTYEDTIVFKGRLLSETLTFDGSKKMKFEGELAYLNDIQFPPFEFEGDYPDLFKKIINYYNSKCDDDKTFTIGQINFFDSNNYVTRSSDSYNSCWNVISDKILNYGGYLKLRYVDDVRYIDLVEESGSLAKQTIEFGKNLLDLENYINTSNIATVLIPLGANQNDLEELEDGVERTFTANKLDIKTVNNNVEFIESELSKKYGRVEVTETWDDVTIPQNLLTKAKKRLNELVLENQTITIKAVDLHWSGENTPSYLIGDIIHTVSKPHSLDTQMILTQRTRNLNDPSKDSFSLGTEKKKLTSAINNSIKNEIDSSFNSSILTNIINHQNKLLTNGKNGNIIYGYNDYGKLSEIYFTDTNNFNTAKNVLRLNNGGIGFSNNGVYGAYTKAWTIDGVFNTDYIRTGKIVGGSGKFSLDLDTGHVLMQDGDFSGKINSSSGTIAGFVLSDSNFTKGFSSTVTYSQSDADKIMNFILGKISLSDDEQYRLDINANGRLDAADYLMIKDLFIGSSTVTTSVQIGGSDYKNILSISSTIKSCVNSGKSYTYTTKIGAYGIRTSSILTNNISNLTTGTDLQIDSSATHFSGKVTITGDVATGALLVDSGQIEIRGNTNYIDFHKNKSTDDYTTRILETSNGGLTVYNTIVSASDKRLKKDIQQIDDRYYDIAMKLKPSQYRFIKGDKYLKLGFIAQEVEEILKAKGIADMPLLEKNDDGIYALDYNGIVAINTKAIQVIDNKLEKLKTENNKLKQQITTLEEKLLGDE